MRSTEIDERFLNRELSWLAFNERVLQLASEPGIPLLERAKFCAIASTNLDEFFQVRVAALKDQLIAGIDQPTWDGRTPAQQLAAIAVWVPEMIERLDDAFVDHLVPELRAAGVEIIGWEDTTPAERVERIAPGGVGTRRKRARPARDAHGGRKTGLWTRGLERGLFPDGQIRRRPPP